MLAKIYHPEPMYLSHMMQFPDHYNISMMDLSKHSNEHPLFTVEVRGKCETISFQRLKPVHFESALSSQEIPPKTSSANVIPPTTTPISSLPVHLRLSFNHHLLQLQIKSFILVIMFIGYNVSRLMFTSLLERKSRGGGLQTLINYCLNGANTQHYYIR